MTRICRKCNIPKLESEFKRRKHRCEDCMREYHRNYGRKWRPINLEKVRKMGQMSSRNGGRFSRAKILATRHGHQWSLTREEYLSLIKQLCYYHKGPLNETGIGLDRLDNSRGYIIDNVVPCCWVCNSIRGNTFSPSEMLKIGKIIQEIYVDRGVNIIPFVTKKIHLRVVGE